MFRVLCLILFLFVSVIGNTQPVFKPVLKSNRQKLYKHTIDNTIKKNLSYPLGDSSEELWRDAFQALGLLGYHSKQIDSLVRHAMENSVDRSVLFQRTILELAYTNYPSVFYQEVKTLMNQSTDPKVFAICAAYILNSKRGNDDINYLAIQTKQKIAEHPDNPVLQQLLYYITDFKTPAKSPSFHSILKKDYLPGQVLMISFQRKNRNYPGLVLVRGNDGNFVKDSTGFFSVPQLARSISNLPGFISNGNTPEGIFRMKGFDQSKLPFIGPTKNIQLTMPYEKDPAHFYISRTTDTTWYADQYKKLLPGDLRNYYPLQQSFYAGKAGRSEIIAHGSTVNPMYYLSEPFFPLTPTQGCLCTKEMWNEMNGARTESDQQKLVNAIIVGGGPFGYAIVVNLNDELKAVTLADIIPLLERAGQK